MQTTVEREIGPIKSVTLTMSPEEAKIILTLLGNLDGDANLPYDMFISLADAMNVPYGSVPTLDRLIKIPSLDF